MKTLTLSALALTLLLATGCSTAQPTPVAPLSFKPMTFATPIKIECKENTYTYKKGDLQSNGESLMIYRYLDNTGLEKIENTENFPFPGKVEFQLKKRGSNVIAQENGERCVIK